MKRSRLRAKPKRSTNDAEKSAAWFRAVVHPKARCVVCDKPTGLQGHHVISQSVLKRLARALRLSEEQTQDLLWDHRNGVAVCVRDHQRHTDAVDRIRISRLPARVFEFIAEWDERARTHELDVRLRSEYRA